jgi:5-methyltetrahydrofolate--homocysteine methyltransferase
MDLLDRLAGGDVIVCDGAIGTMLAAAGLRPGEYGEEWNLSRPDIVQDLHRAYIDAGAHLITTNTFSANRIALERHGAAERAVELTSAGVRLAREAAGGSGAYVAASMGPTGKMLEPLGDLCRADCLAVYIEQAQAMREAGADIIWIETMSALDEATLAVRAGVETGLPVGAGMSFEMGGRTMMGITPEAMVETLLVAGASIVGSNCGVGPDGMRAVAERIRAATDRPIVIQPNAGLPRIEKGTAHYDAAPAELAGFAVEMRALGVNVIGSCCGSTPDHTRAIAAALRA